MSRIGVNGASSASSVGIAAAMATGVKSPKRAALRMEKDFILAE
jgi:hypothetical protein